MFTVIVRHSSTHVVHRTLDSGLLRKQNATMVMMMDLLRSDR